MVNNTEYKKKTFLIAYKNNNLNISAACREASVGKSTFYDWKDCDPDFVEALKDAEYERIKYVEGQLFKNIDKGDFKAIEFFLKMKGKTEGYGDDISRHSIRFEIQIDPEDDGEETDGTI